MSKIDDIVIINRFDYDELIDKANKTDAEIKKQAERIFMNENEVPVRIQFNQFRNSKNFNVPIGFIRTAERTGIWESLDKIDPQIKEWKSVRDLLSINKSDNIEFGWNPQFPNETNHKTEIDMKIIESINFL